VIHASPTYGQSPLAVVFSGDAYNAGNIVYYLWDFENDGIIDWGSSGTSATTHTYSESGTYQALFKVVNDQGVFSSAQTTISVSPPFSAPQADADADPTYGELPLLVNFSGTGIPAEDIMLYEWDFDGDGGYDWSSQTTGITSYLYSAVGTYAAVLRVTDIHDISSTDSINITIASPSDLKAWVSFPKDGSTISGDAVSVRINTAPGNLTKWVQPQYKMDSDPSWTDMTGILYPPPYSFDCSWDVSALTPGTYSLRAKASDTEDNIVYSDTVSVIVVSDNAYITETLDEQGNHEKRQDASKDSATSIEIAGGTAATVPLGALADNDTAILTILSQPPYLLKLGSPQMLTYCRFELGSASNMLKPGSLRLSYSDSDNDGVVDGTEISENSVSVYSWNTQSQVWIPNLGCTVYTVENFVETKLIATGDYALGLTPGPTPIPTITPAETPSPQPPPTLTPTKTPPPTPEPTLTPFITPAPTPEKTPSPVPTCGPIVVPDRAVIQSGDYNGDGVADVGIFRPSAGFWSVNNLTRAYFGASIDHPASGDYNGDGTSELAVFRPSQGLWSIKDLTRVFFGGPDDLSAPSDYDGNGSCDIAIFRENGGMWSVRNISRFYFGATDDWPLPGDWDGNGTDEAGLYRPSVGQWMVRNVSRFYLGSSTDWPIPGDYKGEGALSAGIFRPCSGMWALRDTTRVFFGNCSDYPVQADYSGSGTTVIGIFRDSAGLWSIRGLSRVYLGSTGDIPITR